MPALTLGLLQLATDHRPPITDHRLRKNGAAVAGGRAVSQ